MSDFLIDPYSEDVELETATIMRHMAREHAMALLDVLAPVGAPTLGSVPFIPALDPTPLGRNKVVDAAKAAVRRANTEWLSIIAEPPGRNFRKIDEYIRGTDGLDWPSAALVGSRDTREYTRNGQFQWCGAFAAYCWNTVKPEIRKKCFPSTLRLWRWAQGTSRVIDVSQVQPGDIVVVGPDNPNHPHGAHITIAAGWERDGFIETYEGNATGPRPDGQRHEGVIRRTRPVSSQKTPIYRFIAAYHLAEEDLA